MERLEWAKRVALCVLYVHQYLFTGSGPAASVASALSRDDIHNAVSLHDLSEPEFQAGLCESVAGYRIKSGGPRHLHQQASLVGHLRRIGALGRTAAATTTTTAGQPPPRTFLEVGAGRGMMGLVAAGVEAADVADALANNATSSTNNNGIMEKDTTRLILVERAGSRGKADTVLRQASGNSSASSAYMKLETVQWTRIQCDLAHVDTRAILMDKPQQQDETAKVRNTTTTAAAITPTSTTATTPADTRQLVVIAKHLCGAGTDLALKSLEPIKDQVSACVMATCCHGACSWDHYVGRDFLCQAMKEGNPSVDFGRVEFELLRRWSAGTVMTANSCKNDNNTSSGDKEEVDEHNNNRSEAGEMQSTEDSTSDAFDGVGVSAVVEALQLNCHVQGLGRACQRLIDYGRREYLRKVLFASTPGQSGSAELLYYVPDDITPQNAALVAHR
jgi:tRNA:m4X modification enzyme